MGLGTNQDGGQGAMIRSMTMMSALAAALAVLALTGCKPAATAAPAAQARTVSVVRVALRPIAGGLVTSGLLVPRNQVEINPDITGYRVSKLYVDEGDWVKAGQPLA